MNNTEFVQKIIELAADYDRSRGSFYRQLPTADYIATVDKNTVDSFTTQNSVFHFHTLVKLLKETNPANPPNNQVLAAYLQKKGFSKKKVVLPSSKHITLWSL